MREVIILRGAPGSGKTSLARLFVLMHGPMTLVISADSYVYENGGKWSPEAMLTAHRQCQDQFVRALAIGVELIVIDNTNTKESDFACYQEAARLYGYEVRCLVVENRHNGKSLHNVPDSTVRRHRRRIQENVQP